MGLGGGPIQGNVSSIFKEDFLPFEIQMELVFDQVVDGLEKWMGKVGGRFEFECLFG